MDSLLQLFLNIPYIITVPPQLLVPEFIICAKHEIGMTEYGVSNSYLHFCFTFKPTYSIPFVEEWK